MNDYVMDMIQENDMLVMDDYDDCIVGIVERCGQEPIVCYSMSKLVARHTDDGMTEEEAWEWIHHNQLGAWVGEQTPCFLFDDL